MRRWIVAGATAALALTSRGAPAAVAAPNGGYSVFAQCPLQEVRTCLYAPVEGGYLTLGRTVVPISKTVVLQGGLLSEEAGILQLTAAVDGETMMKVGQPLPGGLFGLPVSAVTELAGPASSVTLSGARSGELALALPVKVRLVSPLLGVECSIGSNSHPIELNLTTGTSGGLTGNPGKERTIEEGGILVKSGVSMVSRGFEVPKAGGCGTAVVDEGIDAKLGLPSSGNTTGMFNLKIELSNSEIVVNYL